MQLQEVSVVITAFATLASAIIAAYKFFEKKLVERQMFSLYLNPLWEWVHKTGSFTTNIFNAEKNDSIEKIYERNKKFKPVCSRKLDDLYALDKLRMSKSKTKTLEELRKSLKQYVYLFDYLVSELENKDNKGKTLGQFKEELQKTCLCEGDGNPNQYIEDYIFRSREKIETLFKELNVY